MQLELVCIVNLCYRSSACRVGSKASDLWSNLLVNTGLVGLYFSRVLFKNSWIMSYL